MQGTEEFIKVERIEQVLSSQDEDKSFCFSDDYLAILDRQSISSGKIDELITTMTELEKELCRLSPLEKIQFLYDIYEEWYQFLQEKDKRQGLEDFFCHKGCSSCCHQPVKASRLEVNYIINYIRDNNIEIDFSLVEEQARFLAKSPRIEKWHNDLGNKKSACPFLDLNSGGCSIHPARPLNCRNFFSVGSSDHCGKSTEHLNSHQKMKIKQIRYEKLAQIATAYLNLIGGANENKWLVEGLNRSLIR